MNKQLQQAMWLQGTPRHFLGPNVTALVPLSLLAAAFTNSHSDASMRILHGYSDLGLVFGIYGALVLLLLQSYVHLDKTLLDLMLVQKQELQLFQQPGMVQKYQYAEQVYLHLD